MKLYGTITKRTLYIIIAVLLMVLFIICKVHSSTQRLIDGSTHKKRIIYLNSQKLMVDENRFTSKEIVIPTDFDALYKSYNSVLRKSGFDLRLYKGKTATLYSYPLGEESRVELLVYKGSIIGGSVYNFKEKQLYPFKEN